MPPNPAIELWTLYSIGVASTLLRFYARLRVGGIKNLKTEDTLVAAAIILYTVQTALAYSIGSVAHGLANNGMTNDQRLALAPIDPEYSLRLTGSKIQVAGWTTYSTLMCTLKLSMLFFYIRLTDGLGQSYLVRIQIGFLLVLATYVATLLSIFTGCQPFAKYWQIAPDPGNACQAAISSPIVWTSFAANVSTDIYLIAIPLPMLWQSSLKLLNKVASTIILGAGIFVLVCAILKSVFVLVDPANGAEEAGAWGTRETFVAVLTTNLPFIFPLIRLWLTPVLRRVGLISTKRAYHTPTGFRTIGGGGGPVWRLHGAPSVNPVSANLTLNGSEDRIMGEDHHMKVLTSRVETQRGDGEGNIAVKGIMITKDVTQVRVEAEGDQNLGSRRRHDTREMW